MIKVTVDGVDKDGRPRHGVWVGKFDGKVYPSKDMPWDSASDKVVNERTNDITTLKDGKVAWSGSITVSKDGKSRTVVINGTDANGKKFRGKAAQPGLVGGQERLATVDGAAARGRARWPGRPGRPGCRRSRRWSPPPDVRSCSGGDRRRWRRRRRRPHRPGPGCGPDGRRCGSRRGPAPSWPTAGSAGWCPRARAPRAGVASSGAVTGNVPAAVPGSKWSWPSSRDWKGLPSSLLPGVAHVPLLLVAGAGAPDVVVPHRATSAGRTAGPASARSAPQVPAAVGNQPVTREAVARTRLVPDAGGLDRGRPRRRRPRRPGAAARAPPRSAVTTQATTG